jgi:hypothetical protein
MKYSLEFLCWVNRCLFPDDLVNSLVKHGLNENTARLIVMSKRKLDILDLYQDYCLDDEEIRYPFEEFLREMAEQWEKN